MPRLTYTKDEIMADHAYARPQVEAGYRLHGGFDEAGRYVSPRTLFRWPAVRAWQQKLRAEGLPVVDASIRLLKRGPYPSVAQQKFLLAHGQGEALWNALTVTGVIEARGRALCEVAAPDFQDIIVEDIAGTCTGHLNKGLLFAHGLDEGGYPEKGEGGHDAMWFAVRDHLFGANAYPHPAVPESLARPEGGRRMPQLPKPFEDWILLLMNVLMIEVRAESFFSFCTELMRAPDTFTDRKPAALHAAELVDRIRQDEAIHVGYLQTFISEMRGFTLRGDGGVTVNGADLIDPVWEGMVEWHAVTNAHHAREQAREAIVGRLSSRPDGNALIAQFDALELKAAA